MSAYFGKDVELVVDGSTVICFRTLNYTHNGELIDLTDSCSNGFRELAFDTAVESIDLGVEGIAKNHLMLSKLLTPGVNKRVFENAQLRFPPVNGGSEGDVISGTFVISAYSQGVTYNDTTTFSATLQSSGEYTYTPEIPGPITSSEPVPSSSGGPTGAYFAASGSNGGLHIYDFDLNITQANLLSETQPVTLLVAPSYNVTDLNPAIYIAGYAAMDQFDLLGEAQATWFDFPGWLVHASLAHGGNYIGLAGRGGSPTKAVRFFDNVGNTFSFLTAPQVGGTVSFSPSGDKAIFSHASDFQGGDVYFRGQIIDMSDFSVLASIERDSFSNDKGLFSSCWSADGQSVYVGFGDGQINRYDATDFSTVAASFNPGSTSWNALIEVGNYLVCGGSFIDGTDPIFVLDKTTLGYVNSLGNHFHGTVHSFDVDSSGELLLVAGTSEEGAGFIWFFDIDILPSGDLPIVDAPCSLTGDVCAKFI